MKFRYISVGWIAAITGLIAVVTLARAPRLYNEFWEDEVHYNYTWLNAAGAGNRAA
jgi:hypothetical protein